MSNPTSTFYAERPNSYKEAIGRVIEQCPVGFIEPVRNHLSEEPEEANTTWRHKNEPPTKTTYQRTNLAYLIGKTKTHEKGSLEETIENLVKSWEMELSHKKNLEDIKTVDHVEYNIKVGFVDESKADGQVQWNDPVFTHVAVALGNYNVLMAKCPAYKYANATIQDNKWQDSHEMFRDGFVTFPWEVIEAKQVSDGKFYFTWRHWGYWGENAESKKLVECIGDCTAILSSKSGKIATLEVTFDASRFLKRIGKSLIDDGNEDNEEDAHEEVFLSALAKQLKRQNMKDLEHDFVPVGVTLETL